ncbi:hypothetical protein [Ensifer soli]|uniref:hypothetical protein n=1 Tax=Ciceribacter sp. sgz301302 TaxID=3342379 RepID=UPI0035B827D8
MTPETEDTGTTRETPFIDRLEAVLMTLIVVGILLVAQQWSVTVFRIGLSILVCATLVQIAVGNVPRTLGVGASILRIVLLLGVVALMFGLGILLAPYFAGIGR